MIRIASYRIKKIEIMKMLRETFTFIKGKVYFFVNFKVFGSLKEDSLTTVNNETNTFRAFDSSLLGHVIFLSIPKREVVR